MSRPRQADGRWNAAYTGSADMVMPQDFLDALATMPVARAFSETVNAKNGYPICHRLQTAKRLETRTKRLALILAQTRTG